MSQTHVEKSTKDSRGDKRYGLQFHGDAMAPVFRKGDVAIVDPSIPFIGAVDREVVIYKTADGPNRTATIGTLIAYNKHEWTLRTYGPEPKVRRRKRSAWPILEYIVDKRWRAPVGITIPVKGKPGHVTFPPSSYAGAKLRAKRRDAAA
jgi:hypothetical protein